MFPYVAPPPGVSAKVLTIDLDMCLDVLGLVAISSTSTDLYQPGIAAGRIKSDVHPIRV